ncbi:hypothetical protein LINPERHAP2_LOCUS26778 [Linum perenne]
MMIAAGTYDGYDITRDVSPGAAFFAVPSFSSEMDTSAVGAESTDKIKTASSTTSAKGVRVKAENKYCLKLLRRSRRGE